MGFTVYANCYAKVGFEHRDAALARLTALHGKSLFVPHAEPIAFVTTDIAKVVTPLAGYEPLAWCRCKVAFALNPRLAFAVLVVQLKSTARSLGPDILILLRDDGEEYGDVSRFPASRVAVLFVRSVVESPLWLLNWLWGLR